MKIYLITHTETFDNKNRIFSGRRESRLTPLGRKQAQVLAKKLRKAKLGAAFVSPMRRCLETLKPIKKHHPGIRVIIDKNLVERDYGGLTGKSKVVYRRNHPRLYEIYHRSYATPPPGGESMVVMEKRILPALKKILKFVKTRKQNVLIIGHSNSVRPIRRHFEKLSPKQMMQKDNHLRVFIYKI